MRCVEFNSDELKLRGSLHMPCGLGRVGAVLCFHGFTGNRSANHAILVKVSRRLEDLGIASLRFDLRGCGESDGEFRDVVTLPGNIRDAQNALAFLRQQEQVDPDRIGLLGFSMGGVAAATLAGMTSVQSVVLWAAPGRLAEVVGRIFPVPVRELLQHERAVDYKGNLVGKDFFDTLGDVDPLSGIAASDAPCLVIHGAVDELVPVGEAVAYFEAAKRKDRRVEKRIISNATHSFDNARHEAEVIALTTEWFSDTLS